jgi:hypothetical protein
LRELDDKSKSKLSIAKALKGIPTLAKIELLAVSHYVTGRQACERDLGVQLPEMY